MIKHVHAHQLLVRLSFLKISYDDLIVNSVAPGSYHLSRIGMGLLEVLFIKFLFILESSHTNLNPHPTSFSVYTPIHIYTRTHTCCHVVFYKTHIACWESTYICFQLRRFDLTLLFLQ